MVALELETGLMFDAAGSFSVVEENSSCDLAWFEEPVTRGPRPNARLERPGFCVTVSRDFLAAQR